MAPTVGCEPSWPAQYEALAREHALASTDVHEAVAEVQRLIARIADAANAA